jgi:hypothetical protein
MDKNITGLCCRQDGPGLQAFEPFHDLNAIGFAFRCVYELVKGVHKYALVKGTQKSLRPQTIDRIGDGRTDGLDDGRGNGNQQHEATGHYKQ